MCASAAGSINVVDVLLQNDASVECLANGLNAEDLARRNKRPAIADYIMKFRYFDYSWLHTLPRSAQEERPGGSFETIEEAYCVICDKSHFDVNHDTSIAHLVNLEQQPAEGYCYGISVKNRGYRMLKSGGWNEGQGLGKNNAGRKYPVIIQVVMHFAINLDSHCSETRQEGTWSRQETSNEGYTFGKYGRSPFGQVPQENSYQTLGGTNSQEESERNTVASCTRVRFLPCTVVITPRNKLYFICQLCPRRFLSIFIAQKRLIKLLYVFRSANGYRGHILSLSDVPQLSVVPKRLVG